MIQDYVFSEQTSLRMYISEFNFVNTVEHKIFGFLNGTDNVVPLSSNISITTFIVHLSYRLLLFCHAFLNDCWTY